jgi:hypothetical protein
VYAEDVGINLKDKIEALNQLGKEEADRFLIEDLRV